MERDKLIEYKIDKLSISTHTLTWSVTDLLKMLGLNKTISTHTLTWSVTIYTIDDLKPILISTHTLTWSVTLWMATNHKPVINFNSHAHVERDVSISIITAIC